MIERESGESWVETELKTADFGDKRLNRRLGHVLDLLGSKPTLSIPSACKVWTETKAAYRFFGHEKVSEKKILAPHRDATIERMRQESMVLLPQDTTELDYTSKKDIQGLGHVSKHKKRRGFYVHPTLAVTPDRRCLGVVHTKVWAREVFGIKDQRDKKAIEDKESIRWLESLRVTHALAKELPHTRLINIADREGDIYECFLETKEISEHQVENSHWIIRAAQDRKVLGSTTKCWETVQQTQSLGRIEFYMPKGRGRKARLVKQDIHATEVTLESPYRKGKQLPPIKIQAVLAIEIDAPEGEKPVEWLLLTSLPLTRAEDALNVIEWYLCRWQIEIYFKIMKSGCQVEELQLESFDRLTSCLAIYMIVAWRVLLTTMLGRKCPDMPCDRLFDEAEWKSVYMVIYKKPPPDEPPTLDHMVRMVASLGGFLNRKGDGYPGVKTVWIGMQRMKDFAIAWELFNSQATGKSYG
jgi:hypothetical protein